MALRVEGKNTKRPPSFNEGLSRLLGNRCPVSCAKCADGDNDDNNKTTIIKSQIESTV